MQWFLLIRPTFHYEFLYLTSSCWPHTIYQALREPQDTEGRDTLAGCKPQDTEERDTRAGCKD